jgi:hypothetical protein
MFCMIAMFAASHVSISLALITVFFMYHIVIFSLIVF